MSSHAETIRSVQCALKECDRILSGLAEADGLCGDITIDVTAALEGAEVEPVQYVQVLETDIPMMVHTVREFRAYLWDVIELFGHTRDRPAGQLSVGVANRHGDRYPEAAAWAVDVLPRRVVENRPNEKTVGYVDGLLAPYVSGIDGTWTLAIESRLRQIGVGRRLSNFLKSHVELKVATMMIMEGRKHSELVINHVPCGSQQYQREGCHQMLERYLPKGYTLTVHGTTQKGEPFSHIYRGQA